MASNTYHNTCLHVTDSFPKPRSDGVDDNSSEGTESTPVVFPEKMYINEEPLSSSTEITEAQISSRFWSTSSSTVYGGGSRLQRHRQMDTEQRIDSPRNPSPKLDTPASEGPKSTNAGLFELENSMYRSRLFKLWIILATLQLFGWVTYGATKGYIL